MLVKVDPNSGVPVYRQIVDQIRFKIAAGILAAGDELPSTRALSLELKVNPMTVSKAWGLLEEEGLLVRRAGLSLMVADGSARSGNADRKRELEQKLRPAVDAAVQLRVPADKAAEIFQRPIQKEARSGDER